MRDEVRAACGKKYHSISGGPWEYTYLGFGHVSYTAVNATLQEVHFGEYHLVIEALELGQKGVNEGESRFVLLGF